MSFVTFFVAGKFLENCRIVNITHRSPHINGRVILPAVFFEEIDDEFRSVVVVAVDVAEFSFFDGVVVFFDHSFDYHLLKHVVGRAYKVVSVGVGAVFCFRFGELELVVHIFKRSESGVFDFYVKAELLFAVLFEFLN